VEIYDFADRLHEVVMDPGDIVYYESAKCLHGRNTPLDGDFYVNLFAHYRPIGDDTWFLKPNPPGTPEPLLDIGKCTVNSHSFAHGQQAVTCENEAVTMLSPTMHTINNSDDLFKWWKYSDARLFDGNHDEL
jgi:hypothetical protein